MDIKQDIVLPLTWTLLFTLTLVISFVCLVIGQIFWVLAKGWPVLLLGLAVYFFRAQLPVLKLF